MKIYQEHYCQSKHRTHRTTAKCLWPKACWISGNGPYASLAWCRVLTVQLYKNLESAVAAQQMIAATGCGGACYNRHEIIVLNFPHLDDRK